MSKKEFIIIIFFSFFVFVFANFAQFWGMINTPPGMVFLGGHLPTSGEILSMVYPQMKDGFLLTKNLFTSEEQPRIFFASSYLPLVVIGKVFPLSDLMIFLVGKLLFTFILFFIFWRYISFVINKDKDKIFHLFVMSLTGGLGFLLMFFVPSAIDLWIPEYTVFHTILYTASFIYSQILMLLVFYLLYSFFHKGRKLKLLFASLVSVLLAFEHQFDILTIALTVFLFIGFTQSKIKNFFRQKVLLLLTLLPAFLVIVLQFFLIKQFVNVAAWTKQTHLDNPSLISFIVGFGIIGFLAVKNVFRSPWEKMSLFYKLNFFWFISSLFLVFMPIPFQRRFLEGIYIPLTIFATPLLIDTLSNLWQKIKTKTIKLPFLRLFFYPSVLLFLTSSNIFLIYQDIKVFNFEKQTSPFYIYQDDLVGLDFIKKHSTDSEIILSDGHYSHLIPGLIGRPVYFGHTVGTGLTINPEEKTEAAKKFFLEDDENYRKKFLTKNNIKFLFLGKKASDTEDFKLWEQKDYLIKIYDLNNVKVFKVKN